MLVDGRICRVCHAQEVYEFMRVAAANAEMREMMERHCADMLGISRALPQAAGLTILTERAPATEAAHNKAMELLWSHLDDDQRRRLQTHGSFFVHGCDTGRRYELHQGRSYNIQTTTDSGAWITLCFGPADMGHLAVGDILLAQKFALELDETGALAVAHSGWPMHIECTFTSIMEQQRATLDAFRHRRPDIVWLDDPVAAGPPGLRERLMAWWNS